MLRIGIDEAGLGPLLGPLVVAGAAFRVPGDGVPAAPFAVDLGTCLGGAVAAPGRAGRIRRGERGDGAGDAARAVPPLVVGDSKQVYGVDHDLASLEVPVLAFVAARDGGDGRVPADLDDLLAAVGVDASERLGLPWYAGPAPALPLRAAREDVVVAASALRRSLDRAGASFVGFAADAVPEERLNASFARTPNKADVLFGHAAQAIDGLLARRRPAEPAGVAVDRQGGRRFYLSPMNARWPRHFAWALEETPTRSRYRVDLGDAESEFRFVVGGDAEHLEIGLASMLAKYLRELFMELWNGYFAGVCPGVPRTAGYALDARRWLDATRGVRAEAGIGDERLVRTR